MSSNLSKDIFRLSVALLKHQAENIFGKEPLDIASEMIVKVGDKEVLGKIENVLDTTNGEERLKDAALQADEYFRSKCTDSDLRDIFTLPMGDLPSIHSVLEDLPKALDQSGVLKAIRISLSNSFPNLKSQQIDYGSSLYLECLNRALLPLKEYTLPLIGNAVLETRQDVREIKEFLERITSFAVIDLDFRIKYGSKNPVSFYDGTVPNWANIANNHDAPRELLKSIHEFVKSDLGIGKMGLVRGLAGEGKTTIIRRLAWELSKSGETVVWRVSGFPLLDANLPAKLSSKVIIFIDDVDTEDQLPSFVKQLIDEVNDFTIIGAARTQEWEYASIESDIRKHIQFRHFPLGRLTISETKGMLDKLEVVGKLDRLSIYSPEQRLQHFMNHLKADGQLLPAMISARTGDENGFANRVENVLTQIQRRSDYNLLLTAYATIACVHRFGYGLNSSVVANVLKIKPDEIRSKILGPLGGGLDDEILEIFEEQSTLRTRHAIVAEKAIEIIETKKWTRDIHFLYIDIINSLKSYFHIHRHVQYRRLLTTIPQSYVRKVKYDIARQLFEQGAKADPQNAYLLQAWALMERKVGDIVRARQLFERSIKADPTDAPSYQAWALMEQKVGDIIRARQLFESGINANPAHAPSYQAWALMEQKAGDIIRARQLFELGVMADPTHAPLWQAWALMEQKVGDIVRARQLFESGIRANPEHAPSYQAWALMEQKTGDIVRARQLFESGTIATPTDLFLWYAWALMEQKVGNIIRARQLFERGAEVNPTHAFFWLAWALMEHNEGEYEFVVKIVNNGIRQVKVKKELSYLYATEARALGRLNRVESSEEKYKQSLALDDNRYARFFYAEFLKFNGRNAEACKHYKHALDLKTIERGLQLTIVSDEIIKRRLKKLKC